jgi:hypothetical protein
VKRSTGRKRTNAVGAQGRDVPSVLAEAECDAEGREDQRAEEDQTLTIAPIDCLERTGEGPVVRLAQPGHDRAGVEPNTPALNPTLSVAASRQAP